MQAILPVAGLGTRFLPWTKAVPKELLPLGTQPIIAHLVDECIDAGITDICFVISEGKESIAKYFEEDPRLTDELTRRDKLHHIEDLKRYDSVRFHTVYQKDQLGDGHAILQASDWVEGPVAILFGDDLFIGDAPGVRQLIEAHKHVESEGAIVALENVPKELIHKYGVVEVHSEHEAEPRLKKLKGMVEKPHPDQAPSSLGIVGRYILPKSTFDILPQIGEGHGGEIRIIDALIEQLKSEPVHGYECKGTRLDTGTPEGYRDAVGKWGE
ncbi:NTP transferase domain-containing protein [Patescibacteria group bacterium]|nr:NTP transferase domain-containing protein [Patescibacteria group bacterium]MBU1123309.1 NTP transferase domain-containing protein [Patescibacteria group bacterium]MBU1910849.1 NTP transferase domain-containing protein [Patescibacteria group bacterium]